MLGDNRLKRPKGELGGPYTAIAVIHVGCSGGPGQGSLAGVN